MIKSFKDKITEDIYNGNDTKLARKVNKIIWKAACRKLDMLNAAKELKDLTSPPANRLEKLKGNISGYHSIRLNDQYRIIFIWSDGNASSVQIIDYHK
ncbi:MAG: type II toxin-antitoxin system RelE/ParE family toxin [bacterium]|nr:type II toxin-antitoxin system RelE/ParE family toxin [bacterium]